jgi:hypothetical protein
VIEEVRQMQVGPEYFQYLRYKPGTIDARPSPNESPSPRNAPPARMIPPVPWPTRLPSFPVVVL